MSNVRYGQIELWARPKIDMGSLNSLDYASTIVVRINEARYEMSWGRRTFEVQPGTYSVSVCLTSWLVREKDDAEFEMVSVGAGETVHVRFTSGLTVFQRGTVTVDGSTRSTATSRPLSNRRQSAMLVDQYDRYDVPNDPSLSLDEMFEFIEESRRTPPASASRELTMQDLKAGSLASLTLPLPVNTSQDLIEEAHSTACELLAVTIMALRRCRAGETFRHAKQAGGTAQSYFEQLHGIASGRIDQLSRTYPGLTSFEKFLAKRTAGEREATPGKACSSCRKVTKADAVFCDQCGQDQRKPATRRCAQCGATAGAGRFCGRCGGRIA